MQESAGTEFQDRICLGIGGLLFLILSLTAHIIICFFSSQWIFFAWEIIFLGFSLILFFNMLKDSIDFQDEFNILFPLEKRNDVKKFISICLILISFFGLIALTNDKLIILISSLVNLIIGGILFNVS
jgi:hypothetical protein